MSRSAGASAQGFGILISGFGVQAQFLYGVPRNFRCSEFGVRVLALGLWNWDGMPHIFSDSEFRVQGFGFRVVGFGVTCHTDF